MGLPYSFTPMGSPADRNRASPSLYLASLNFGAEATTADWVEAGSTSSVADGLSYNVELKGIGAERLWSLRNTCHRRPL